MDEQLMTQLLADPQLEQRALLWGAGAAWGVGGQCGGESAGGAANAGVDCRGGSQHDSGKANKMMFVAQAVRNSKPSRPSGLGRPAHWWCSHRAITPTC